MAMYTTGRTVYVQFPRIDVGDVLELRYRIEDVSARNAFADYFGEVTNFPSDEPVGHAEYVLITPKSRTFYFNEPRIPGLKRNTFERGNERVYQFTADNLAPLEPEPLQPPYSELLGYVHVSTYKSWDDVGKWYWGLVRDQFVADDEVKRRAQEITKGLTDSRSKIKAVYDFVVQKTRYVALEFGIHGFKPYRCAQIFARGFGDCKDKATLIVTMLRELGIPATIVIVRTGLRGDFDEKPASLAPFDHAIAYVPEFDLYLDGTAEWTGSNELPAMDRGSLALQINEGKAKLVRLPDPPANESLTSRSLDLALEPDGKAQVEFRADVAGVSAPSWRERYHAESTRKSRIQEDLAGELGGFEVGSVEASDLEDVEKKVSLRVRGKAPQVARREGERLSLPVGPRESMVRDYAALSRRRLDLRIRAKTTTEQDWKVKLAPGMRIVQTPTPAEGTTPYGTYKVTVDSSQPGSVRVQTKITIDKTRISAAEYGAFRSFCEAADRALGQRLVVATK
jgi:transglutaminase-like putative cysteine protease